MLDTHQPTIKTFDGTQRRCVWPNWKVADNQPVGTPFQMHGQGSSGLQRRRKADVRTAFLPSHHFLAPWLAFSNFSKRRCTSSCWAELTLLNNWHCSCPNVAVEDVLVCSARSSLARTSQTLTSTHWTFSQRSHGTLPGTRPSALSTA